MPGKCKQLHWKNTRTLQSSAKSGLQNLYAKIINVLYTNITNRKHEGGKILINTSNNKRDKVARNKPKSKGVLRQWNYSLLSTGVDPWPHPLAQDPQHVGHQARAPRSSLDAGDGDVAVQVHQCNRHPSPVGRLIVGKAVHVGGWA